MAGSVDEQFSNLLQTLRWVDSNNPTPSEVYQWLRSEFGLSHYFARDVYTVLFISSGLVKVHDGKCRPTSDGQAVLTTASPVVLLEVFEKTFAGVVAFLEILRTKPHVKAESLNAMWFETVKERFPRMRNWSGRTLNNQCRHRIDWLRTMGLITFARGLYLLSESGWQFVQRHPPEAIAIQPHEIGEQEKQLGELILGEFQPFDLPTGKTLTLRQSFVRDRAFREIVATQYDCHCAVCEFRFVVPGGAYEAEAAHIIPKHRRGTDDPRNGICLCGTCHWLFDEGAISVRANNLSIIMASYLERKAGDKSVQRVLEYGGKQIRPVENRKYAPATEALQWHNEQIFLG
jgi:hypothetical protein